MGDDTRIEAEASSEDASTTDASADLEHYPRSVSRFVWAKVKKIDAGFKTRLNQGADRNEVVCETLQYCFDLLAEDALQKKEDLNDRVQRWEIQNSVLAIAVNLEWLAPEMAPNVVAWGHREWLMKLLEGRIAYFESRALDQPLGALDKPDCVVLKVPETNVLFQSEETLEVLKQRFNQTLKVFDLETLKLHAASAYGVSPEKVTREQLGATIYAFGCKYGGIKVAVARVPGEDDRAQQSEQAVLPTANKPPKECISRPLGSSDRLLANIAAQWRSASAQLNQGTVEEMQPHDAGLSNTSDTGRPSTGETAEFTKPLDSHGETGGGPGEHTVGGPEEATHRGERLVKQLPSDEDAPSDGWALERDALPPKPRRRGRPRTTKDLHPEVEEFLRLASKHAGHDVRIQDFCRVAGFADDTIFGVWRRGDKRKFQMPHARAFEKVLKMSPQVFLDALATKRTTRQ